MGNREYPWRVALQVLKRPLITVACLFCSGLCLSGQSSEDDEPRLETIEIFPIVESEQSPVGAEPDLSAETVAPAPVSVSEPENSGELPSEPIADDFNTGSAGFPSAGGESTSIGELRFEFDATGPSNPPNRYSIQLGAYSTMARAEQAQAEITATLAAFLRRHDLTVAIVSPRQDGLWRILIEAEYQARESASALCNELKSIGSDCFVSVRTAN